MANFASLTSDDEARAPNDRASGQGIVLAGDRTPEFRRAGRHSVTVRALRLGLPLSSVAIFGLYVWTMLDTAGYGAPALPPSIPPELGSEIAMDNPRYEGFTKDGGKYNLTAKTAIPDLANPSQIKLNAITGEVYDAKQSRTDLTATRGFFDSKANKLDLMDGIDVVTQTGMHARLATATLMTKEGTLVSETPVEVDMPSGKITSNRLSMNQKTKDVTFLDNVVAHLVPAVKPVDGVAPATKAPANGAFGSSKAPADITADRLDVHDAAKTARFEGHVRAVQGIATLETEALDIAYAGGGKSAVQPGDPAATGPDPAAPATKIERIVAPGPVVLTQGSGDRVTGNSADFDAVGEVAVITGSVVMTSAPDKRATSERAEFQQKADTILLTGGVVVIQGRNELRGRRLFVDRKGGRTELSSPAEGSLTRSRIFARLYQGDPAKPASAKKPAAAATEAASPFVGAGIATFKTDPNAPVDIEADKLIVEDQKKEAVFTGDVKAVQGDFIIHTSEMHAFYSGEAGLSTATAAAGAQAKTPAQLTKIEAKGKVLVTSKANQQVTGDWAIFDTKANTVTVGGDEVIVTQDKNIVRCNKLSIDMPTGQSTCIGSAPSAMAAPGATATDGKRSRPSMVFYPQERQKDPNAPPKPAAPAKPASSSWESTVAPQAPN